MVKKFILMFAAVSIAQLSTLNAQIYSEDFESGYVAGSLAGQNGWASGYNNTPTPAANVVTSIDGNYITSSDNSYNILDVGNFNLSESNQVTLTFDIYLTQGGSNALFGIGNYNQATTLSGMPPLVGVQSGNWTVRGWSFGATVLARSDTGTAIAAGTETWYRVQSVWDLDGSGNATLAIMNLTAGDTEYTQLYFNREQTQATASLGLDNANNPGVDEWGGVTMRISHDARITNLNAIPEPQTTTLAIASICSLLLLIYHRKR